MTFGTDPCNWPSFQRGVLDDFATSTKTEVQEGEKIYQLFWEYLQKNIPFLQGIKISHKLWKIFEWKIEENDDYGRPHMKRKLDKSVQT